MRGPSSLVVLVFGQKACQVAFAHSCQDMWGGCCGDHLEVHDLLDTLEGILLVVPHFMHLWPQSAECRMLLYTTL